MKLLDKVFFTKEMSWNFEFSKMGSFEPLGFKVEFSNFRTNLTFYTYPSITFHTTYVGKYT